MPAAGGVEGARGGELLLDEGGRVSAVGERPT